MAARIFGSDADSGDLRYLQNRVVLYLSLAEDLIATVFRHIVAESTGFEPIAVLAERSEPDNHKTIARKGVALAESIPLGLPFFPVKNYSKAA